MSISPDCGHGPYLALTGNIQMPGQSQSPAGRLAVTSTRPYLIVAPALVLIRPDLTGLTIVPLVTFVTTTQLVYTSDEQLLSCNRSIMLFFSIKLASWREGLM